MANAKNMQLASLTPTIVEYFSTHDREEKKAKYAVSNNGKPEKI